jgi:hypothetical protein
MGSRMSQPPNESRARHPRARSAGSLRGDLHQIAASLHRQLGNSDITVWTASDADIYFEAPDSCPEIAPEKMVGTYGVGASVDDIVADLGAMRHECISNAMIE